MSGEAAPAQLLRVAGLRHAFGETEALRDCNLDVRCGEIHALLGENGSGKSTLVKILSGVFRPDAGILELRDGPASLRSPAEAQRAGVASVFQEALIADELSVLDNVLLGADGLLRTSRRFRATVTGVRRILDELGLEALRLDTPLWQLALSERQIVTIVRALVRPWRLLVLDEATSALGIHNRDLLFAYLSRNRGGDRSVLFISHRIEEIRMLCDRVTVLRSGVSVSTLETETTDTATLLRLIAPEASTDHDGDAARSRHAGGKDVVLRVRDVALRADSQPVNLELRAGEILGLTGLEGQGQVRFLECLAGLGRPRDGKVEVLDHGRFVPVVDRHQAIAQGIAYVPPDRKRQALFLSSSVEDNLSVSVLDAFTTFGLVRVRSLGRLVEEYVAKLRIKTPSIRAPIAHLSGGNQQKVIVGRALSTRPRVLVLNDPLRGVDHGVKLEIYGIFERLAEDDVALVFHSTQIEELIRLCPRVAVFQDHAVAAVFDGADVKHDALIGAMFGHAPPVTA